MKRERITRRTVAERYDNERWPKYAMSHAEIGERVGLSRRMVEKILIRAHAKLRAALASEM